MNMIAQKPVQQKPQREAKDPAYLGKVRALPCCVCVAFGLFQTSITEAHHTIFKRFGTLKTPDRQAIPLCQCHHQGLRFDRDKTKLAIHRSHDAWVAAYGPDTDYIAATQDAILETNEG